MSDTNAELAARVEKLEAEVKKLEANLKANNGDLYDLLVKLLAHTNAPKAEADEMTKSFVKALGARIPPGCPVGS